MLAVKIEIFFTFLGHGNSILEVILVKRAVFGFKLKFGSKYVCKRKVNNIPCSHAYF